jgi:hypothetical protein
LQRSLIRNQHSVGLISVDCLTSVLFLENNRYPADPYDRFWQRYNDPAWTNINTTANLDVKNVSSFEDPNSILQSAAIPKNGTRLDFAWSSDPDINNDNTTYLLLLYFAELQRLPSNALRLISLSTMLPGTAADTTTLNTSLQRL